MGGVNGHARAPISARELMAQEFADPRWAVPGLLPEGLALIAARPKIGKTWMMLGVAIAVAQGGRAMGMVSVDRGEALYLALEDTPRRLQGRLLTLLDDGSEPPAGLYLETVWPRVDASGIDVLASWLGDHPDCRLVVVDTLAKVRPRSTRRDGNRYDEDYDALAGLKQLADEHGVAIVVVHHLRKGAAEDPLDRISGTLGLSASPDTILVLERSRGKADATLHLTGRDVEEAEYALSWTPGAGAWVIHDLAIPDASAARLEIIDAIRARGPMTPTQVAEWIKRPSGTIKPLMSRMFRDGQLDGGGREGYTLPHLQLTQSGQPIQPVQPIQPGTVVPRGVTR